MTLSNNKIATLAIVLGIIIFAKASYMDAKAVVAQHLIAKSWDKRANNTPPQQPWSWADTSAIATIEVPRLKIKQYVMRDSNGESLAFGPGHLPQSNQIASNGHSMISGHRDSHFAFLKNVHKGDKIITTHYGGKRQIYTVKAMRILDTENETLSLEPHKNKLTLITCFPFDSIVPGGPLRWLVEAEI